MQIFKTKSHKGNDQILIASQDKKFLLNSKNGKIFLNNITQQQKGITALQPFHNLQNRYLTTSFGKLQIHSFDWHYDYQSQFPIHKVPFDITLTKLLSIKIA